MYRQILLSNPKLLSFYFLGAFLVILLLSIIQQSWKEITIDELAEITDIVAEEAEGPTAPSQSEIKTEHIVSDGDNLASVFGEAGISPDESAKIIKAFSKLYNPRKINIGTNITFDYDQDNKTLLNRINVRIDNTKRIEIRRTAENKFIASETFIPLVRKIARRSGVIKNNFIATASQLSIPNSAIMNMVKAFSYDVDFQRDLKSGDEIEVLYDLYYTQEGKFAYAGGVLYASLHLKKDKRNVEIYRYNNSKGEDNFYNAKALAVRKEFLRTPVNAARISSGFGMRYHPVLGFSRMHKGIDFAAPIGTPILAAASGTVEVIGRKGGYGRYIRIRHNNVYSTAYAHASRFAKGLKKGMRVKQGQVIAYIGKSGVATGPHLHYEVLKYMKQINPKSIKSTPGAKLIGKELRGFRAHKRKIEKLLQKTPLGTETLAGKGSLLG
jgi:murein DD-endopeptidase MepM/ murein hydrolase activator NlpD